MRTLPILLLAPAVAAAQHIAYGIEIGGPAPGECPRTEVVGSVVYGFSPVPCIEAIFPKAKVPLDFGQTVMIVFPPADSPAASTSRKIGTLVKDGRVAVLVISTAGASVQGAIFDSLLAKYGKPTSSVAVPVQNALGAKLESIVAKWDLGEELQVEFVGVAGRINSGQLLIGTKAGLADRQARLDKAISGRPL